MFCFLFCFRFICLFIYMCFACIYVLCHVHVSCLRSSGVLDDRESPCGCWELATGPLQAQKALFTTEPFSPAPVIFFFFWEFSLTLQPIFKLGCLFSSYLVLWVLCVFLTPVLSQTMYSRQRFYSILCTAPSVQWVSLLFKFMRSHASIVLVTFLLLCQKTMA